MSRFVLLIFFVLASLMSVASPRQYSFKHITMNMGLSHNQVNDIFRDSDGFMWFATAWGLNRFDGYSIQTFFPKNDSLPTNYVDWIRELDDDIMLLKSSSEIAFFDKKTGTFSNAKEFFASKGVDGTISQAFVDSSDNIWIACGGVCYVYSQREQKLVCSDNGMKAYDKSRIVSFAESYGQVVLLYDDGTMLFYAMKNGVPQRTPRIVHTPMGSGSHSLFIDSDSDYWVIADGGRGLWFYEQSTDKWYLCTSDLDSYYMMPSFVVNGVAQDRSGKMWIVSDHGGINIIDKRTHAVTRLKSRQNDDRCIPSNSVSCIYCDGSDNVWIGDVKCGISLYNEAIFKFDLERFDDYNLDPDFLAHINSIDEDRKGNMWYGTNGFGLLSVKKSGEKIIYRHSDSDKNTISGNIVVEVYADHSDNIWIGTYLSGLSRYDGTHFHSYKGRTDIPESAASENIWSIAEDQLNRMWIGSLGRGLAMYDASDNTWKEFLRENSALTSNYITQIYPAKDGRIFVGTVYGLSVIDMQSLDVTVVDNDAIRRENISDIYLDSRGLLWVGSTNGLYVLDGQTYSSVARFNTNEGLQNDVVTAIIEDNDKNMWVTTISGMTNIVVTLNPREENYTFSTYKYNHLDGFMNSSTNNRAIKKTSYGEIMVGGTQGINIFRPDQIKYNREVQDVRFTGVYVLGNPVKMPVEMPYCEEVVFEDNQNMFTISFSSLSYILPEKVSFEYMLEGFNDKWIKTAEHYVTYTNLAPGTYTLKVKAVNCDGFSSDTASELRIVVLPPWWRTPLAYVIYIALLLLILVLVYRAVLAREKEKYRLHEIEVEATKKHEMDDMKLSFFTNISHELRTPLSLIISPIENILESHEHESLRPRLEMVHRNAQRLLNMVNQLLDFRKIDSDGMKLNLSEGDMVAFAEQSCTSFRELLDKNTKLNFVTDLESLYMEFDSDKMQKVLNNLISNAFKFTPDEGRIDVMLSVDNQHKNAVLKVADTGIGISDEHKAHVFERFYQVGSSSSPYGGSGIGLHLVKEFIDMHKGSICVYDNIGGGTVFEIILPIHQLESENLAEVLEEEAEIASGKSKIVIVDDNADFRTLLNDTLSDSFEIIQAKNGQEALELIRKVIPELIISDVMMPVMDGNELCKAVKTDITTSHIPVILLTAKTAEEHKIEGLMSGADDYIEKPFNPQILKLRIEKLTNQTKKRQETFKSQIEPEPSQITITPIDEKLIQRAIKYVEDNIENPNLSVEELSRSLGMSRVHFYKKTMSITGRSPIEFIRVIRIKRAAQMLRDKQLNVADVAYAVGFNNPKYFSRYFRDEFGVLPSVYQNNSDGIQTNIEI
ncbi:MAG: response regulator [Bacteroidales bacterium]|nr:response regulator [Bacteroidales bacterium]